MQAEQQSEREALEVPITAPGMVKVGDTVCFTLSGKRVRETVKLVLDEGTDREELIYNKRRNYYLITSMCMAGTGSQKDVCVLRTAPQAADVYIPPDEQELNRRQIEGLKERLFGALNADKFLAECLQEVDHAHRIDRGLFGRLLDVASGNYEDAKKWRAALSHPSTPQGWISVLDELPPDREIVVVGWLDVEDHDHAERYSIDYFEEGVWQLYFNEHEHYLIAGVARGNSEDAPYTHWQRIGAIPAPPEQGSKG